MAADRYLRSTDGSDADNGTTWALAKATLTGLAAIDTAGDRLFVSQVHNETTASSIAIALAGTLTSPTKLLCGNDGAEPPTALATTGAVSTTGTSNISITGSAYVYGIVFTTGDSVGSPVLLLCDSASHHQTYESCDLIIRGSGSSGAVFLGTQASSAANSVTLNNCRFKFAGAAQGLSVGCRARINGGSIIAGGTNVTTFMPTTGALANRPIDLIVTGFDFSNLAAGLFLCGGAGWGSGGRVIFRNCKLPGSWSGALLNSAISTPGFVCEMHNCDSGNTNYRMQASSVGGDVKSETTIVRTGGASDGTTPLSWKMTSGSNVGFPSGRLESPEIVFWNDTTGSSKTVTVEFVHDTNVAGGQGAGTANAFQDDEVWLEVHYLGDGSFPISTMITDAKATVLTAAADQASSSTTWTTTGLTTPVKQAAAVTLTPNKKGPYVAKVCIGKASKTIYIDPMITVT